MRGMLRDKALRVIISSLLISDLTANDLRMMSRSIMKDPSFLWDLATLLEQMVDKFNLHKNEYDSESNFETNELVSRALDAIQRRRLSKQKILKLMDRISPESVVPAETIGIPIKKLITTYFGMNSPSRISDFVNALEGSDSEDPYLRGILNR